MEDPALWHRLQFAFTITYHYLFPQLTMGLAWFLVYWKWRALRTGDERYAAAARFWARIFGLNFAVGVVTGIPMEFQFGTNSSNFSNTGAVIGQTLAMEGMFAFLLESAFVGALVFGEKRLGPRQHFLAALAVAVGSWLSGYFILVTNAFMQHPVGYVVAADGTLAIGDLRAYLLNPWALVQFAHNQAAALVTGTFAVTAVGAFYVLRGSHPDQARLSLKHGTVAGLAAAVLVAFPTGDLQAKMVARYQEPVLAAMEGRFETGPVAEITLIGRSSCVACRSRLVATSATTFGNRGGTSFSRVERRARGAVRRRVGNVIRGGPLMRAASSACRSSPILACGAGWASSTGTRVGRGVHDSASALGPWGDLPPAQDHWPGT